jgi:hypothetical protein
MKTLYAQHMSTHHHIHLKRKDWNFQTPKKQKELSMTASRSWYCKDDVFVYFDIDPSWFIFFTSDLRIIINTSFYVYKNIKVMQDQAWQWVHERLWNRVWGCPSASMWYLTACDFFGRGKSNSWPNRTKLPPIYLFFVRMCTSWPPLCCSDTNSCLVSIPFLLFWLSISCPLKWIYCPWMFQQFQLQTL